MQLSYETIGDLDEDGHGLNIHCRQTYGVTPCNHHHKADLKKMIARYGPDQSFLYDALKGKIWCLKCGSMNVDIRLAIPDRTPGAA